MDDNKNIGVRMKILWQVSSKNIEEVKKFGGTLSGIWHNYDLSDDKARHEALYKIFDKAKSE